MINTIEVAPAVLAASLAKTLLAKFQIYSENGLEDQIYATSEMELREFIRDFLKDDFLP